jgi:hypothetical protein
MQKKPEVKAVDSFSTSGGAASSWFQNKGPQVMKDSNDDDCDDDDGAQEIPK